MNKADQKAYLTKMAAQLKRQESAINSLSATEYKAARNAFAAVKRNPAADAAQEDLRNQVSANIRRSIGQSLVRGGMSMGQAKIEAVARTKEIMSTLAALHNPDMVAGGWMHPDPTGIGRADVNASIGASWNKKDRIRGMDREAEKAIKDGRGEQKMNVKLEPCRGKGIR